MTQALQPRPRLVGQKQTIVIVVGSYNTKFVQGMVNHAAREIEVLAPSAVIVLRQVPGAFEIPLAVKEIAKRNDVHAVIAFGVAIRAGLLPTEPVARSVADALQRIALDERVPIIHEVLFLESEADAAKLCLESDLNRGTEAARSAVAMIHLMDDLRERGIRSDALRQSLSVAGLSGFKACAED